MVKNYFVFLFSFIVLLTAFSCKKSVKQSVGDSQDKLYNLANAGWKSKSISHHFSQINYKATQVPLQYYILKNGPSQDPKVVDSVYASLNNERIIEFEFKHEKEDDLLKGKYTKKDYTSSVKYMAFGIKQDYKVVTQSGDTIACSGVTFERNFKLAPFKRLLLHFGNIPPNDNIKLIYEDKLFGNGIFKFNFKQTPIKL